MRTCPSCQSANEDLASRCARCGGALAAPPDGPSAGAAADGAASPNGPVPPPGRPAPKRPTAADSFFGGLAGAVALGVLFGACAGLVALGVPAMLVLVVAFLGWVGAFAAVLFVRDRANPFDGGNIGWSVLVYFLVNAVLGPVAAVLCVIWLAETMPKTSCPHVYASDGAALRLDADPLSGAFLRGAERDDLVRLEHARAVDGHVRLEIRDELREKDGLDLLELVVVDHDPGLEVLPTQEGSLVGLRAPALPLVARDRAGADRLADVRAPDDGAFVAASAAPASSEVGAETLELSFARPEGAGALALALRAHVTPFAEDALARYLATFGPGLGPLLGLAEDDDAYAFHDRIHDEIRRLGLPLFVEVADGDAAPYRPAVELVPVGPAIQRTQAVPLPAPSASSPGPIRVRLRFTPRFWAIDEARLGAATVLAPTAVVKAATATAPSGSVVGALAQADGQRVVLSEGERIDVDLAAPEGPEDGCARTWLLHVRGYYEAELGGGPWLDPGAIAAHRLGLYSLPRLAAHLARARPELVASEVW